jgi:putative ABC transport system substrate-binding protein
MRRIGAQMNLAEDDLESKDYVKAFEQGLAALGWIVGRNVQIEYRWTRGEPERIRQTAAEFVALNPDVILTVGGSQVGPLQRATRTVPIVFVQVILKSAARGERDRKRLRAAALDLAA